MTNLAARLCLGTFALCVAGCASAPLSFLDGQPQTRTDPSLYPLRVVSVDGSIKFNNYHDPVQVAPGPRWFVLEAAPARGAGGSAQKSFVLKIAACTSYHLAARRSSPMAADWSLVIDSTESVAGCNPEEEYKKANSPDGSPVGPSPQASSPS